MGDLRYERSPVRANAVVHVSLPSYAVRNGGPDAMEIAL